MRVRIPPRLIRTARHDPSVRYFLLVREGLTVWKDGHNCCCAVPEWLKGSAFVGKPSERGDKPRFDSWVHGFESHLPAAPYQVNEQPGRHPHDAAPRSNRQMRGPVEAQMIERISKSIA